MGSGTELSTGVQLSTVRRTTDRNVGWRRYVTAMTGSAWIATAASFAGAGLACIGAWVGTHQRERQGRREERGRRFTASLTAMSANDE